MKRLNKCLFPILVGLYFYLLIQLGWFVFTDNFITGIYGYILEMGCTVIAIANYISNNKEMEGEWYGKRK